MTTATQSSKFTNNFLANMFSILDQMITYYIHIAYSLKINMYNERKKKF